MPRSARRDSALLPALEARARVEQTAQDIADATEMFFDAIPGGKLIPIDRLHEWGAQPRKSFDEARMVELTASIAEAGVLEPLIVRRHPEIAGDYVVTAGMRRLLAARRVHGSDDPEERRRVETLPCVVREAADPEAFADALIENLVRQDLTRREVMDAVHALHTQYAWGPREIGRRTGRDHKDISEMLRVADDPDVYPLVADEAIAPAAARPLVEVKYRDVRGPVIAAIAAGRLKTGPEIEAALSKELRAETATQPTEPIEAEAEAARADSSRGPTPEQDRRDPAHARDGATLPPDRPNVRTSQTL